MTFSVSAVLETEVDQRSLKGTRRTIEDGLSPVSIGLDDSGISSQLSTTNALTGTQGGGLDILNEQTAVLHDIHDTIERGAVSAGGGLLGGRGVLAGGAGGGFLSGVLGGSASKISASKLIKVGASFPPLFAGVLAIEDIISGNPTDIVGIPMEIGEFFTGGLTDNDLVEGTIGISSILGGSIALKSLLSGTTIGSILSSGATLTTSTLSGLLGSVSIGGVLTGLGGGAAAAGGAALGGLLGTTALGTLLTDDEVNPVDHITKMEFGQALIDTKDANVAVADYISPAPLDEFIEDTKNSLLDTNTGVADYREGKTSTAGYELETDASNNVLRGMLRQELTTLMQGGATNTELRNEAQSFAAQSPELLETTALEIFRDTVSQDNGSTPSSGTRRAVNRAKERQQSRSVDVTVNNEVTIRDERDLRRKLEAEGLNPEAIRRVVNQWQQVGPGGYR